MASSENDIRNYINRILMSRMRLLSSNAFYGLLLMHMNFGIDESIENIATNGRVIFFKPDYLRSLTDKELDFMLMHEVMHCVLRHVKRKGKRDSDRFDRACDIVVNSNILESSDFDPDDFENLKIEDTLPDGTKGCDVTAEEAYAKILTVRCSKKKANGKMDDHSMWSNGRDGRDGNEDNDDTGDTGDTEDTLCAEWNQHLKNAVQAMKHRETGHGSVPMFAERVYRELMQSKIDWKTVLTNFVQENIKDYSFNPPDRRYADSEFFLPDFNDIESVDSIKNILFMVDTSGSISEKDITKAYSEIKGAIDQFDGRLTGRIGFFDSSVKGVYDFCDENELLSIKPVGGGGTSFNSIFEYVNTNMTDTEISNMVILTDGYAEFPLENVTRGIPVLWLMTNDVVTPPWGNVAVMK